MYRIVRPGRHVFHLGTPSHLGVLGRTSATSFLKDAGWEIEARPTNSGLLGAVSGDGDK